MISAYLDHLAVERGVAANTVAAYRRDLSLYAGFLGPRPLAEVGEAPLHREVVEVRGDGDRCAQARTSSSFTTCMSCASATGPYVTCPS